jgi:hypothetical protein
MVYTIKVSVITVAILHGMFEGTDLYSPQAFLTNPSKLPMNLLCKIPTVIAETLIV